MVYTSIEEVVPVLREHLQDYLRLHKKIKGNATKFCCIVHNDNSPSMVLDPKNNRETAHCFGCGANINIFDAANIIEGLPTKGREWVVETIPHLASLFNIQVSLGEPSAAEIERYKMLDLARTIVDIAITQDMSKWDGYIQDRAWNQDKLTILSCSEEYLKSEILAQGWDAEYVRSSGLLGFREPLFGEDRLTFVLRDTRGRPIGFNTRNFNGDPKYIHNIDSNIFHKANFLAGLDIAIKPAKLSGLMVVEGTADLASLYTAGFTNASAVLGTALTVDHLYMLRTFNIREVIFAFDWDSAGQKNTARILKSLIQDPHGMTIKVLGLPNRDVKDLSDLIASSSNAKQEIDEIPVYTAFEWYLRYIRNEIQDVDIWVQQVIPFIASEPAATRRELMAKKLAELSQISYQSILSDVKSLRNKDTDERRERILAAAKQYTHEIEKNPDNITAAMAHHEKVVRNIETEYQKDSVGVSYQVSRFQALQEMRESQTEENDNSEFKLSKFKGFAAALEGSMPWTYDSFGIAGGRANHGKTGVCNFIATDIAMTDPDAICIVFSTDDSYARVEPRQKTNVARIIDPNSNLPINMVVRPFLAKTQQEREFLKTVNGEFTSLLAREKLVIIDSVDGPNLTTLEKHLRFYRTRYPSKKIFIILDNSHNLQDYSDLDRTQQMTRICDTLKSTVCGKYQSSLLATAEYRKKTITTTEKIIWPCNDDLADARAFMYRPDYIFHVYNDLRERGEDAAIYGMDRDGSRIPRLCIDFSHGKNKISDYNGKLFLDIDPKSVTLTEVNEDEARHAAITHLNGGQEPGYEEEGDDSERNEAPAF